MADHESTVANAVKIGARIAPIFFAKSHVFLPALLAPLAADCVLDLTKETIVITNSAKPPTIVVTNAITPKFLFEKVLKSPHSSIVCFIQIIILCR